MVTDPPALAGDIGPASKEPILSDYMTKRKNFIQEFKSDVSLCWRVWENEFVVYNCQSGDTHLLDIVAAETLKTLQDKSSSMDELPASVAKALDIDSDDELYDYIRALLEDFERLGLAEQISQ